ncbi:unnamed protein product [Blepharisma stoltei]|uniref:Kelch repeat-containing protein n=1 Tax=Blepharisma stoltei TaxID=1481888 RepID=A0AAU9J564_9CILI|nr:unnamed protein product [Blepharisma stoltei]
MCEKLELPLLEQSNEADLTASGGHENQIELIQRKIYSPYKTSIISWDAKTYEKKVHANILPVSISCSSERTMTCLFSDTQLFIYGGFKENSDGIKEAMVVDLVSMEVKLKKSGRKRGGAGLALVGWQIYIFGGYKNEYELLKECDKYDILTNKWIRIASLPFYSGSVAAEVYGNDILVAGTHLPGLYYYSVGKNTFSKIKDLPILQDKNIFVHEGKAWIYCNDSWFYESKRYDLTKWRIIGYYYGFNMLLSQHVRIENELFFLDNSMGIYVFDLHTGILDKFKKSFK